MDIASWFVFIGVLLLVMAVSDSVLSRLPLSSSMLYLLVGMAISPMWLGWTSFSMETHSHGLELLAEIVVLLSLFTSGLKMSPGLADGRWRLPLRLAVVSMLVTVALSAIAGSAWFGMSIGFAVLLGGILAPTDPVLASAVQLHRPGDRDRLRFALTGEGGLNDGTAFPIVFFGLGLLGYHRIGAYAERWIAVDLLWGVTAGLAIGAALGTLVGWFVLYVRATHKEAVGLDNFLALGLIGVSYGVAQMAHSYGFLAVFAAAVALRRVERIATSTGGVDNVASPLADAPSGDTEQPPTGETPVAAAAQEAVMSASDKSEAMVAFAHADPARSYETRVATDPKLGPAYMTHAVLTFNEQLERIGEMVVVVTLGALIWTVDWGLVPWGFIALLLLVIRPLAVAAGLLGSRSSRRQRMLIGWFGIRGVGSLYYLMFAVNRELSTAVADQLFSVTIAVIVTSIVVHGISVTPLMRLYARRGPPGDEPSGSANRP